MSPKIKKSRRMDLEPYRDIINSFYKDLTEKQRGKNISEGESAALIISLAAKLQKEPYAQLKIPPIERYAIARDVINRYIHNLTDDGRK